MAPERPPARPARSNTPKDTKSVLYEAAVQAVQNRAQAFKTRTGQASRKKRRRTLMPLLLLVELVGALLLLIRPTWLAGPTSIPQETPAVAAASLRVVLVRERDLVLRYLRRTGSLPATLEAAGSGDTGLDYVRQGAEFSVTGHAGDSIITIRSSDSVVAFLGDSFDRLRSRNAP
jgi:hypothetical protein